MLENNDIYLLFYSTIVKYHKINNEFKFSKIYKLKKEYSSTYINNFSEKFADYLASSYDSKHNNKLLVFVAKFNLYNGKIKKEIRFNDFKGIEFSNIIITGWILEIKIFC